MMRHLYRFQLRNSAVTIPQPCGCRIKEENIQGNNIIDDVAAEAFDAAVPHAVQVRSCIAILKLSSADRKLYRIWRENGISLAIVEGAVILGSVRKTMTEVNRNDLIVEPVRSLAYFVPLIDEVRELCSEYLEHAERTLHRAEARLSEAQSHFVPPVFHNSTHASGSRQNAWSRQRSPVQEPAVAPGGRRIK
jgi:hypothetical protein